MPEFPMPQFPGQQLPGVMLMWDESAEPMASFVGYRIYRRPQGGGEWTAVALVTNRSVPSYTVYSVASGVVYDFGVTVVSEISGDEIESDIEMVQSSVSFECSFLHDVQEPWKFVPLQVMTQSQPVDQDMALVQPAGLSVPVPHFGRRFVRNISITIAPEVHTDRAVWDAILSLTAQRYESGGVLCYRDALGEMRYCVPYRPVRNDQPVVYGTQIELREVHYQEGVGG